MKLDLAVFTANQFRAGIQPTDAEIEAQFDANPETYRLPEKRRVRYLAVDGDALRAKMTATPQEVEARYQQNLATYSTPEQVRASHILLKTEGKDEAAVRSRPRACSPRSRPARTSRRWPSSTRRTAPRTTAAISTTSAAARW